MFYQIPFVLNGKKGITEVSYGVNESSAASGFDLLKDLLEDIHFEPGMCVGYPTMHAYVKSYEGSGYAALCAWIQIATNRLFSSLEELSPAVTFSRVDGDSTLMKQGVPFFAWGYPAEIYDAPALNLLYWNRHSPKKYERLEWIADTFLVTFPSRINNDTVSYLLGFRWGYEECTKKGSNIKLLPFEITDEGAWKHFLPLLIKRFPERKFE